MKYKLEYLADPEAEGFSPLHLHGVGTFGGFRINRKAQAAYHKAAEKALAAKTPLPDAPKPERMMTLPCSEAVARQFAADEDETRFAVHGLPKLGTMDPEPKTKTKKGGK